MGSTIRRATAADAPKWLDLVQATLGAQYPVKAIYDPAWIAGQLDADDGPGNLGGGSRRPVQWQYFLSQAGRSSSNPVANLGRNLFRPESMADGSAEGCSDRSMN